MFPLPIPPPPPFWGVWRVFSFFKVFKFSYQNFEESYKDFWSFLGENGYFLFGAQAAINSGLKVLFSREGTSMKTVTSCTKSFQRAIRCRRHDRLLMFAGQVARVPQFVGLCHRMEKVILHSISRMIYSAEPYCRGGLLANNLFHQICWCGTILATRSLDMLIWHDIS